MKKFFYILLGAFLMLAGCNGEDPETAPEENPSTDESLDEEARDKTENESDEEQKEPVEEPKEEQNEETGDTDTEEENKEEANETQEAKPITVEEAREIIEYNSIGEGDKLTDVSVEDGEIKATIDLAPSDMFTPKDIAVTRYSQLSDELLNREGWEILTMTYVNIGTVSMNRNEKESNEYGDYFPTMEIEEKLK
jgi:outer membrane biosynthesis protein TonB